MSEIRVTSVLGENGSDPVGLSTGFTVGPTSGTTATITHEGQASFTGIVTATSFVPTEGQLSHRNKVINGAMTISQRGASFAAANNVFTLDRYKIFGSHNGAVTVTQSATSPDGFAKSLKVDVTTADTSIAAGQYIQLNHRIEAQDLQDLAYGTSDAKTITVSFYVRSNVTGNYSFAIQLPDNSNKQVSLVYTINSANTWERKTFSIAGDTSGGINDDNGNGFNIFWNLAIGSQYTSGTQRSAWHAYADADFAAGHAVNLLSSTSNEWHLTGVQIEVGDIATAYEFRTYGEELMRCMRYYERQSVDDGNGGYATVCMGYRANSTRVVIQPVFRVPKRATNATFEFNGPMRLYYQNNSSEQVIDSWTTFQNSQFGLYGGYKVLDRSGGVGGSDGYTFRMEGNGNTSAYIAFSSEI